MVWVTVTQTDGSRTVIHFNCVRVMKRSDDREVTTLYFDQEHCVICKETPDQIINQVKATMKI